MHFARKVQNVDWRIPELWDGLMSSTGAKWFYREERK
jgi:hypothetical protein